MTLYSLDCGSIILHNVFQASIWQIWKKLLILSQKLAVNSGFASLLEIDRKLLPAAGQLKTLTSLDTQTPCGDFSPRDQNYARIGSPGS